MDPALLQYVDLMLERSRKENIPIVFWRPPVHPTWKAVLDRRLPKHRWDRLVRRIVEGGGGYLDLSKPGSVQCDYYMDPVHFGGECVAEIFARKLQYLGRWDGYVRRSEAPAP